MKNELDLFSLPLTQTSIENSAFLHYKPVSSLSNDSDSPLEFLVPSSTEHYIDLAHTMLRVTVQILPVDTEQENAKVGPVNNFIHSLFDRGNIFQSKIGLTAKQRLPIQSIHRYFIELCPTSFAVSFNGCSVVC